MISVIQSNNARLSPTDRNLCVGHPFNLLGPYKVKRTCDYCTFVEFLQQEHAFYMIIVNTCLFALNAKLQVHHKNEIISSTISHCSSNNSSHTELIAIS